MKNMRVLIDTNVILDWIMVREPNATNAKRKMLLQLLCEGMNVIPENRQTILQALRRKEWQDIEDALQMQCAKEAEVDYIITQNLKDFQTSDVEAISEEQFCRMADQSLN